MKIERRSHKRFAATAFLNMPVKLAPLPPYFGQVLNGKLIDLSAAGMAVLIKEMIPQRSKWALSIKFPDQTQMTSQIEIIRVLPKGRAYLTGIEFLNLSTNWVNRVDQMSADYINCESRIASKETEVCVKTCSFYSLCTKVQKLDPVAGDPILLEMALRQLDKTNPPVPTQDFTQTR